jgi:hypothetical protein
LNPKLDVVVVAMTCDPEASEDERGWWNGMIEDHTMGYGVALEITIRVVKAMSTVGVSTSYGPKTRQPLTLA